MIGCYILGHIEIQQWIDCTLSRLHTWLTQSIMRLRNVAIGTPTASANCVAAHLHVRRSQDICLSKKK